ncbi:unnamed protein product [Parascedosporium putredinis]|uniref:Uncharacterized protein n=1 Tax=Parascedosporium putredinis TaxID=1442378 RepID=A0A9P1H7M9_9PEZI|nr:unnamed protein product [Parascedosporium putredinis]CAI8001537.1 unnamed protein product [Parascedosporium putredinis]
MDATSPHLYGPVKDPKSAANGAVEVSASAVAARLDHADQHAGDFPSRHLDDGIGGKVLRSGVGSVGGNEGGGVAEEDDVDKAPQLVAAVGGPGVLGDAGGLAGEGHAEGAPGLEALGGAEAGGWVGGETLQE